MKKLYVVGMGPGDHDSMTIRADRVLRECDVSWATQSMWS